VKTNETFDQLINRLSGMKGLGWMEYSGTCANKEMAVSAVNRYIELGSYYGYISNNAWYALDELDKFDVDETTISVSHPNETKNKEWKPTEQEIRDCCGIWVDPVGIKTRVIPFFGCGQGKSLLDFECADEFHSFMDDKGLARLEPIPEQCIPKPETPKESYQIRFPLLAGVMT
jgi:hypothetical protein